MKSAYFIFNFDSKEEARIISESLNPEIKNSIPKTSIEVSLNDKIFSLKIESSDISSLRAACNSYLRWIKTALDVTKKV
jgi:tRNA threonylcarbamoyladenosine modification (KEOPS) complex  Pcc1 subunit